MTSRFLVVRSIEVPESRNAGKSRVPRAGPGAFVLGGARRSDFLSGAAGGPGVSRGVLGVVMQGREQQRLLF